MRELRVVGVEADGTHVICQDAESGERYRVAADERLRAAARGDISRLGQIEIEMESTLRPREIQARIRAGATVSEVAALAGVPVDKIERFAHPVLLERARATELASMSHPIREDGPSVSTLGETVTEAMVALGQSQHSVEWDAWKGDDGYWVVQASWHVGRTDNHAHWRFQPGSHGGTADPLDDLADELTHPETITPRRKLTPVATPDLTPHVEHQAEAPVDHDEVTLDADRLIDAQRTRNGSMAPSHDEHGTVAIDFGPPPPADEPERTNDRPGTAAGREEASPAAATTASGDEAPEAGSAKPRRRTRKPAVPAWEDVLLGVRSNGNG
ncbi:septation protein SepH [Gordonia sp. PKS22-38]|uniref:Septation protein SepH n=1 Tax=Gordonia prachuapensis TaxID=3115651 RepID=A0ABU7MZ86_9ACTN|nr:septation protein SepH [Gordonia sp. PKS22-38]